MVASSVTGTGPGESFGKYKPENNCGCGCGSNNSSSNNVSASSTVSNCSIRYNICKTSKLNINCSGKTIKIC